MSGNMVKHYYSVVFKGQNYNHPKLLANCTGKLICKDCHVNLLPDMQCTCCNQLFSKKHSIVFRMYRYSSMGNDLQGDILSAEDCVNCICKKCDIELVGNVCCTCCHKTVSTHQPALSVVTIMKSLNILCHVLYQVNID